MIGTVLVPLDGSELSERALVYATILAEQSGAPVMLLRVLPENAEGRSADDARDYLRHVAEHVPGRVQFEVCTGRAAEVIADLADEVPSPIIVMSTHGRGGVQRWMTGSVADRVVRSTGKPVLLVRASQEIPREVDLRNIMVPLDGSENGEVALDLAAELAKLFGSEIHLVRVIDTPAAYAMLSRHMETAVTGDILDEIIASMRDETREYLNQKAQELRSRNLKVKTVELEGYAGQTLVDHERAGHYQLVVMSTAGRSGLGRVVFGSVAERVLKLGRSPVLLIRPSIPQDE